MHIISGFRSIINGTQYIIIKHIRNNVFTEIILHFYLKYVHMVKWNCEQYHVNMYNWRRRDKTNKNVHFIHACTLMILYYIYTTAIV